MNRDQGGGSGRRGPSSDRISHGILLEGKYRLLEQIGRGGMGTVFRAIDEFLDREVAIKFLLPQFQADPSFAAQFALEARALASVRHPNVLEVYSFGTYGHTPFFVMEYIRGLTMADILAAGTERGRRIFVQEAVKVTAQASSGLAAVHRAEVVHRDIKPANLMVQAATRKIILMDFGLGQRAKPSDSKLDSKMAGGTPAYMAPELFLERQLDIWEARLADIYSLGATAYELFCGRLPVEGENWFEVMRFHLKEQKVPPPSSLRPELPLGLDDVIMRCLQRNPSLRFQRCEELQQALLPFIKGRKSQLGDEESFASLDEEEPVRESAPPPEIEPELSSLRSHPRYDSVRRAGVLVADPDPGFRTQVLQHAEEVIPRCTFNAARTNLSALKQARKWPPAVLLASLHDTSLNGLELIGMVRGEEQLRFTQVILTAERITSKDKALLEHMGVFRTVLKTQDAPDIGLTIKAAAIAALRDMTRPSNT